MQKNSTEAEEHAALHLVVSTAFGGAEQAAGEVVRRAQARGEKQHLIALRGTQAAEGLSRAIGAPVAGPVAWRPARLGRVDGLRLAAAAARVRQPHELVHAHLPWPDRLGVALLARGRAPMLVTFQLLPDHDLLGLGDVVLAPVFNLRQATQLSSQRAPLVFSAVSDEDARRLRLTFPGIRVERIYNTAAAATGAAPAPLPFGSGTKLFMVGSLTKRKGFDRILRALAAAPARSQPFSLCIAGEGEDREALAGLAMELGISERVQFVGRVPAPHLYSQADLFLSGSRAEGLPLVLVEAMTAGTAVAVSDIPAHREAVDGMPEALLHTDEGRWPEQLARLLSDAVLRNRLAEHAKRQADRYFSTGAQDDAFRRLYRELTASSNR